MCADAVLLAVCADVHLHASVGQLARFPRRPGVGIIFLRGNLAAGIGGSQRSRRNVRLQQRMFPNVGVRTPVGVAARAAVGDDQRRRIVGLCLRPHLQHVLIEGAARHVMLDRCVAVLDQAHVHVEQRAAFGNNQHIFRLRRSDHHLPLFATRLVVVLHAPRALGFQAADVRDRIVELADLGEGTGGLGAIDDLARREYARG